mgnify:CR=1 FL=1
MVFPAPSDAGRNDALRAHFGATPETNVLLNVGMFRPEKNQRELVQIVAGLPTTADWQLWLAGDGPARAACERLAATLGLSRRVHFLGFHRDPAPLYAAADVDEWAWLSALVAAGRHMGEPALQPGYPSFVDEDADLRLLRAIAAAEHLPRLPALREAARAHGLPLLLDDEQLSIGMGSGSRTWDNPALPTPDDVPWQDLHAIPVALVTGSNGKTTTVRLLTAIAIAHGWHTANSCTDGLYLDGALIEGGDYSGPAGARSLLRDRRTQAAILETARGGLLRRGLAIERADVAVVTNVSPDHFGEYGIHDLDGLAEALGEAPGPLEIVEERPQEVALHRHARLVVARLGRHILRLVPPQGTALLLLVALLRMLLHPFAHELGVIGFVHRHVRPLLMWLQHRPRCGRPAFYQRRCGSTHAPVRLYTTDAHDSII